MSAAVPPARRSPYRMPRVTWHRSYTAGLLVVALFFVYLLKNNGSFDSIQALGITNAALPLGQWQPIATNVLSANGDFTLTATNTADPAAPSPQFFILQAK